MPGRPNTTINRKVAIGEEFKGLGYELNILTENPPEKDKPKAFRQALQTCFGFGTRVG